MIFSIAVESDGVHMINKNDLLTLKTRLSGSDEPGGAAPLKGKSRTGILGLFAVGFAVLGIFTFAPVFVPLALILGMVALLLGQFGLGLLALALSLVGILTSPTLMLILGLGTLGAWFGF